MSDNPTEEYERAVRFLDYNGVPAYAVNGETHKAEPLSLVGRIRLFKARTNGKAKEGYTFFNAERFTERHRKLEALYDRLSEADLDMVLALAEYLADLHDKQQAFLEDCA